MSADGVPPPKPLAYAEALRLLRELAAATPRPTEWIPAASALHRILAAPITAPGDIPGFRHSAMDGFALPRSDATFAAGASFTIVGETLAGGTAVPLVEGGCVAVATGARVPDNAGTVVPHENTRRSGDRIELLAAVAQGTNIRAADDDFPRGHRIADAGSPVDAALIATATTCGLTELPVLASPRVTVVVTGDEIVPAGTPARPGQRIDSNGPLLVAWFAERGISATAVGPVADDAGVLREIVASACARSDLVIVTGGASVGPVDHTPAVFRALGEIVFWRVAVKPGMPVLAARIGDTLALGLPGNPVSVFAGLIGFVAPLLRAWNRQAEPPVLHARLAEPVRKGHGRLEWRRGTLAFDAGQCLVVRPNAIDSSGAMRSVVESNTLVELSADGREWAAGDVVPVLPYRPWWR